MPHGDFRSRKAPSLTDWLIGATWAVAVGCLARQGWTWGFALEAAVLTGLCCSALLASRKQEAALRASETRFRRIVETAHEGICLLDTQGRATYVNQRLAQTLGYSREEMLGQCLFDLMVQTTEGEREQYLGLATSEMRRAHDFRFHRKDGAIVRVQMSGSRIQDDSGVSLGALVMIMDITERLALEERLRETSKLESVDTLAAGTAHDFGNLLQGIIGDSHLLLEGTQDSKVARGAARIRRFADRGAELVRQLLAFARRQRLGMQVLDLNAVIQDSLDMLRRLVGEDIEVQFVPGDELARVRADSGQIEQMLLNLTTNARDAMPQGGTFRLETADVSIGPGDDRPVLDAEPGPYVRLTVSDTGVGMDEETVRRAFEPFYSTKGAGKGTGLGLSSVYGTVKQHGGHIVSTSEPSQGATFHIYLPSVDQDPAAS